LSLKFISNSNSLSFSFVVNSQAHIPEIQSISILSSFCISFKILEKSLISIQESLDLSSFTCKNTFVFIFFSFDNLSINNAYFILSSE
jgi:hypothetical protein